MAIKKISAEEAKKVKGKTDWKEVDTLTDEEIEEAAKSDPDTALPTEEELKQFKKLKKHKEEQTLKSAPLSLAIGIRARMRGRVYLSGRAVQLQQIAARAVESRGQILTDTHKKSF